MKKWSSLLISTGLACLLAGCGGAEEAEAKTDDVNTGALVQTTALQPQSFSNFLEVTGTVKARNHVNLVVEESGILRKVRIDKGRYAQKGDTLAILENKVLEATYRQTQALLKQAEMDFRSRKALYDKKAISENEFMTSRFSLDAAQAAMELARARYEKLFITAPLSGLVNDRFYDLGAYASPMTPIYEQIDNAWLKISAGVAERFLSYIKVGTPVEVTFDAYPGKTISGKVNYVSRSIDARNRTFRIEVGIPNKDRLLAPQMIANIKILREAFVDRIVVPIDALIESEAGWYVYVANGNVAKKVPVEQVAIYENQVMVNGLESYKNLIVVGHQRLSDGDTINVVNQVN